MAERNIVAEIVARRMSDIESRGYCFGFNVPEKRNRPIVPFMQEKGVILEIKRASPSKGPIAPELDSAETARTYAANGASAISCLTEENYFRGSLGDLMNVCAAVDGISVLRKDFLVDEEEVDVSYRCGADAVLLISGILGKEKLVSMAGRCASLGIRALVEVRSDDDAEKALEASRRFPDTVVFGVNSRNLKDFSIDLMVPAMLKGRLGGRVIFESGITTPEAAAKVGSMGFSGILLGEFAARNPETAGGFVRAFRESHESPCGRKLVGFAPMIAGRRDGPLVKVCGLTRTEDVELADSLGADMVGFIFASGYARNACGERFARIVPTLGGIRAKKVAVITDCFSPEAREAVELASSGTIDFIQLHGIRYGDVPEYIREVPHYFAVTESCGDMEGASRELASKGEPRFLQDCRSRNYFDDGPLWMAGGLDADNVADAVARFRPELVDVSGGIESGIPGIKDEAKMRKFFEEIRRR